MKYFIDTEFLEGTQDKTFLGIKIGKTKPTIDLISIGIVSEDGREYYAISKDFNLKEAWNRFDLKYNQGMGDANNLPPTKVYWLRKNVLKPIHEELCIKEGYPIHSTPQEFTYKNFKRLINKYGKTNKQIAEEIKNFVLLRDSIIPGCKIDNNLQFYAYYADYDWVVFCWLFGKMIDLPKGFPMYCHDLKQELDRKCDVRRKEWLINSPKDNDFDMLSHVKSLIIYPKQTNEHNALADARWNKELYNFLNIL